MIFFRRKVFFSLFEILLVLSLVLFIGSFATFSLHQAMGLRRFETNRKNLQYLISFCREMSVAHQMDIKLVIEEDRSIPQVICQIFCEEDRPKDLLNFVKKRSSFEPLFFSNACPAGSFECNFYSSGFVETNCESIRISDGKRDHLLRFSPQFYFQKIEAQKPIHPFSLKKEF